MDADRLNESSDTLTSCKFWAFRDQQYAPAVWAVDYWESTYQYHRPFVVEMLSAVKFDSLLEIGSGPGPNLRLIHDKYPNAQLTGLDVNLSAVQIGNICIETEGWSSVASIQLGRIQHEFMEFAPNSVDIVLSCYALAYISAKNLPAILSQMLIVARKAVVIAEPMKIRCLPEAKQIVDWPLQWRHDYCCSLINAAWEMGIQRYEITIQEVIPSVNFLNAVIMLQKV